MLRRLLPTLVMLGAGFASLTAFLVVLEFVFLEENQRGHQQEAENRLALESFASTSLERLLFDDLDDAVARIHRLQAEPLGNASGLIFIEGGAQLLPRLADSQPHHVEEEYRRLISDVAPPPKDEDDPWAERLAHLEALKRALTKHSDVEVEREVRTILKLRERWVLPPDKELPFTLALLELLQTRTRPSAVLVSGLLREGLAGERPVEGLMSLVVRAWPTLGQEDLDFLCGETLREAQRGHLDATDFARACASNSTRVPAELKSLGAGRWLIPGKPFAVARVDSQLRGSTVDVPARMNQLTTEMQLLGLMKDDDRLDFATKVPLLLKDLKVAVHAHRFEAAARAREDAFVLKTTLVAVTFGLGLAIVAAAIVAQQRKYRFVELKSDFVSTVSHELRTPLTSVRLLAETLERRLEGNATAKDYPKRIVSEVDALELLVENLLSFNRIDKGRFVPRKTAFAFSSLKPALFDDALRYPGAQVELSFVGDATLDADPDLMRMLFQNLVRNACRYNERDPVKIAIEVKGESGAAVVQVTDNGVGIPLEAQSRVFEPFHRVEGQRGRGGAGSGLGLPLCRRIATLHQGSLTITRSDPTGTTFCLRMPLRA